MTIINTEHAPGAIGPYSQAYETNGLVITSGQLPVNPADGTMPEGIAAQAEWRRCPRAWCRRQDLPEAGRR